MFDNEIDNDYQNQKKRSIRKKGAFQKKNAIP